MAALVAALGEIKEYEMIFQQVKGLLKSCVHTQSLTEDIPFHCAVAASFGKKFNKITKEVDGEMMVAIRGTIGSYKHVKDKSWKNVQGIMAQNSFVVGETPAWQRSKTLTKHGGGWFQFTASKDLSISQEVHTWFNNLVNDQDILEDTKIKIDELADIVSVTSLSINNLMGYIYQKDKKEKTVLEVGMIRYPDYRKPRFKLYRIQLHAWYDVTHMLIRTDYNNGIRGHINGQNFVVNKETIEIWNKKYHFMDTVVTEMQALLTN